MGERSGVSHSRNAHPDEEVFDHVVAASAVVQDIVNNISNDIILDKGMHICIQLRVLITHPCCAQRKHICSNSTRIATMHGKVVLMVVPGTLTACLRLGISPTMSWISST